MLLLGVCSTTSSSTTTSTTSSTSSSTTTTLVDLVLLSAEVVDNFSAVLLTFDKPARLSTDDIWDHASTLSKAANCSEVFGDEMMAALGTPDICTWSQDWLRP
eukprot:s1290_g19.t1